MGELVSPLNKGLGAMLEPIRASGIAAKGWNLLNEDLSLPCAVLYEERLAHNLDWMRRFVTEYGVALCPHGKTTMAPALFRRQLEAGAWGITLANAPQVRVAYEHGVRRVIMANQLVGRENMSIVSRLLADPGFEFYCLVDSPANVDALGVFFQSRHASINVLLEVGVTGGRSGVRNREQLGGLLSTLDRWRDHVRLCGVELFEGVLKDEAPVRSFLRAAVDLAVFIASENRFDRSPFILSGAGSGWFDIVAEVFTDAEFDSPPEIVLRPGCYLTHDVGLYVQTQERIAAGNPVGRALGSKLLPALHLWAYVQSIPDPGLAIVGLGKRDASFDVALPSPALQFRPGAAAPVRAPSHWTATKIMDQHLMLSIRPDDDLKVGDMIAFDIAHPCLTFDKWRYLTILDRDFNVVELVQTFF